jgi:hypothetical protein
VRTHAQVRFSVLRSAKVLSDVSENRSQALMLVLAHLLGQDRECPVEAHDCGSAGHVEMDEMSERARDN